MTETRDPIYWPQRLQNYQGYLIMRYLENIKPGKNGGGWVDPLVRGNLDRYGEQIAFTLFGKAKEVTLFHFDSLLETYREQSSEPIHLSALAPTACFIFEKVDAIYSLLGNPIGIATYKPYHSSGENYLHTYLGMLGIPLELYPEFPQEASCVLLTESAKDDSQVVTKMKEHLMQGKTLIVTSGLLDALQGRGIEEIVDMGTTRRKMLFKQFKDHVSGETHTADLDILTPKYISAPHGFNELISGVRQGAGLPLLLKTMYQSGTIYVLVVPDQFADMYRYPPAIVSQLRKHLTETLPVTLVAPSQVCLFLYDNNTVIVHSFLPHKVRIEINLKSDKGSLTDLLTEKNIEGRIQDDQMGFGISLKPHDFRAFRYTTE